MKVSTSNAEEFAIKSPRTHIDVELLVVPYNFPAGFVHEGEEGEGGAVFFCLE